MSFNKRFSCAFLVIFTCCLFSFNKLCANSMKLPKLEELIDSESVKKIWIDCDPGNDDILALIMAALQDQIQIIGISSSAGNTHIAYTTQNTLDILKFVNQQNVAVYQGLERPLLKQLQTATYIHGQNGLGGITFGTSSQQAIKQSVMWKIRNSFMEQEDESIILVVTGPMTNIAVLLRSFPQVKKKISLIVAMGGAIGHGNVSPAAEFNFYVDPQAAKMVFSESIPIVLMPLDLTHKVLITQDVLQRLKRIKNELSQKLYQVFIGLRQRQFTYSRMRDSPSHDPTTIYYLKNPNDYECKQARIQIQTQGSSKGRSNCWFMSQNPNAYICERTNAENFWNYTLGLIEKNFKQNQEL